VVRIATDDALQRDDWRSAARALKAHHAGVIVVSPADEARTLRWYRPNLPNLIDPGFVTREVAVVELTRAAPADRETPPPPPGFRTVATVDRDTYRLTVARAPQDTLVSPAAARASALTPDDAQAVADLRK
jgi:hypothetical protein